MEKPRTAKAIGQDKDTAVSKFKSGEVNYEDTMVELLALTVEMEQAISYYKDCSC